MEVIFKVNEDILTAYIRGDVDHHSASPLRQAIDKSMKAFECRDLILDFSGVTFMDSSGIGIALGRFKKISKAGGRVIIAGCSEYIAKLLEMAGVFTLMQRADTDASALDLMRDCEQLKMEV